MKKLLIMFSLCSLVFTAAYSQDDTYYTDDQADVTIQSQEAPPALPDYVQPPCPGDGYIWTPGYWAWGATGYYWVAGVWVMPPSVGLLWTPGYWGFYNNFYGWHRGYWGEHIGYYGGINYGFGYYGTGFCGGRWEGGHFRYNTAVWRVNSSIHNTYVSREGIVRHDAIHASFNGPHGVNYRPAEGERGAFRENHTQVTKEQMGHEQKMGNERGQFNHPPQGRPAVHSMNMPDGQRYNQGGHVIRSGGGEQHRSGGGQQRGGGGGGHSGGHSGGGRR